MRLRPIRGLKKWIHNLRTSRRRRTYPSQFGQDKFLNDNFFKNKKDGVFVEIGALDGVRLSNTLFFEKHLGWTGLCIEPSPVLFDTLVRNRECHCVRCCVADKPGRAEFLVCEGYIDGLSGLLDRYKEEHLARIEAEMRQSGGNTRVIEVDCRTLNQLLEEYGLHHVDFCSIDTEGNEYDIVKSIDYDRYQIDFFAIENNYGDPEVREFLLSRGYEKIGDVASDELFRKKEA